MHSHECVEVNPVSIGTGTTPSQSRDIQTLTAITPPPMLPSGSIEIREPAAAKTKLPLKYMEWILYLLVCQMLMFNVPFFMFLPLWIEYELKEGSRPEAFMGIDQKVLLTILLVIGSLDFIQPLITTYVKNHIRLQCLMCFVSGVIANFAFMVASVRGIENIAPPLSLSILAAVFTGFCNCMHLFEYFIREMTSNKKKQSEIIENVALFQILGMIGVSVICTFAFQAGEMLNKHGFAVLNAVSFVFGVVGTVILLYFFRKMPPKKYYPHEEGSIMQSYFEGIPVPVQVILAVRWFISFNFGIVRVVLPLYFKRQLKETAYEEYITPLFTGMIVFGIICACSIIYFTRDIYHENKWIWFPYIHMCISGIAPVVLLTLALADNFWFQYFLGYVGTTLSFTMQIKLTVDRNLMSTDKILPKTSNLSLIANGAGTFVAVAFAPFLEDKLGIKTLAINAGNLSLVFVALVAFHMKTSIKLQLEQYRDFIILFENKFLKHLHDTWMSGKGRVSQVGKTRLLCELKEAS